MRCYDRFIGNQSIQRRLNPMIIDNEFLFSSSHQLLQDVSTHNLSMDNLMISMLGGELWKDITDSEIELRKEEMAAYKCFEC